MKKTFMLACALAALFLNSVYGQNAGAASKNPGGLYAPENAGFSMRMPAGWTTMDFNQKYLMITGPLVDGFTPNINFGDEPYAGKISDYMDAVVSYLTNLYADFALVQRTPFQTTTGLKGESVTLTGKMNEIHVRQKMYVLAHSSGAAVMAITCTAPFAGGEKYDAVFDECVKTFDWKK